MQLSELRAEVQRRLNESTSSPVYFEDDDVDLALNDGYREISDASEWYETSDSITLVADQLYYDLDDLLGDVLLPLRIQNDSTSRWLTETTWKELDATYQKWQVQTGEPQRWVLRGLWQMGFWPFAGASGDTLTMKYAAMPSTMSADTDTPGFPARYHYTLVEYACYDLLVQEGEVAKALRYWNKYLRGEATLRDFVKGRSRVDRSGVVGAR